MYLGQFAVACRGRATDVHAVASKSTAQSIAESFAHRSNDIESNVSARIIFSIPFLFLKINYITHRVIQQVITALRCNDLMLPVKRLATERDKLKHRVVDRSHSIYRDILFLALTAIGRSNVDMKFFHREYAAVFDKLTEIECNTYYRSQDFPPSSAAICCRAYFKPLQLP